MRAIIIGAGKFGFRLAKALNQRSIDIILIDQNEKAVERINDQLDVMTVLGSGTDFELLRSLDIPSQDLVISVTSSDETNTLICSMAKKLGCPRTIARIRNPEYTSQTEFFKEEMGIDYIVNPDLATASEIVRYLLKHQRINLSATAKGKLSLVDISSERLKDRIGKPILDIEADGLMVGAYSRGDEVYIPDQFAELKEGDILYVIGKRNTLNRLNDFYDYYQTRAENDEIRSVMIMGGGKTGYYLSKRLLEYGMAVTIIEQDRVRSKALSEEFRDALIINGDGTDIEVLQEERIEQMDAFISVTGFDEQNLLMALMAKQSGCHKVVAKISRSNYETLVDRLPIDNAFNPITISIGNIIRFIHNNETLLPSLMLAGQTEITELMADENTIIVGHTLAEIPFPKGIKLGAVIRNNEVLKPLVTLKIQEKDRLILFSHKRNAVPPDLFSKPHVGGFFSELSRRIQSYRGPSGT